MMEDVNSLSDVNHDSKQVVQAVCIVHVVHGIKQS